jgi:hypothetical protein
VRLANYAGTATSEHASLGVLDLNPRIGLWLYGPTNAKYQVETATNLTGPSNWFSQGAFLLTNGSLQLEGPQWTNGPIRFYKLTPVQ